MWTEVISLSAKLTRRALFLLNAMVSSSVSVLLDLDGGDFIVVVFGDFCAGKWVYSVTIIRFKMSLPSAVVLSLVLSILVDFFHQ
jgi:hypothetical protein